MGNHTGRAAFRSGDFADETNANCREFVDDYGGPLYDTYNAILDGEAEGSQSAEQRDALNEKWIELTRVLHEVGHELRTNECSPGTVNAFERLYLDTLSSMRARIPTVTQRRIPPTDAELVLVGGPPGAAAASPALRLHAAYYATPGILNVGRHTLSYLGALMRGRALRLLVDAGRDPEAGPRYGLYDKADGTIGVFPSDPADGGDTDMFLRLDATLPDAKPLACGDFRCTVGELRALGAATQRYIDVDPADYQPHLYNLDRAAHPTFDALQRSLGAAPVGPDGSTLQIRAERVVVVGPVRVVFDACGEPQAAGGRPIVCVSIVAPNLGRKGPDRASYVAERRDAEGHVTASALTADPDGLRRRIAELWRRALTLYAQRGVAFPVLSAVGCGVFKGRNEHEVIDLPTLYAEELCRLLRTGGYPFAGVAVALPCITESDVRNFEQFRTVFQRAAAQLPLPVLLSPHHSMVDLADRLARDNPRVTVGILNASDVMAVLGGLLGMFCEEARGTFALEELLGLQTTLRTGHIGVTPAPWSTDPVRCVVGPIGGDEDGAPPAQRPRHH